MEAELRAIRKELVALAERLNCPISQAPPSDPVVASDGHTYDRASLETWRRENGTSPVTREVLLGITFPNRQCVELAESLEKIIERVDLLAQEARSRRQSPRQTQSVRTSLPVVSIITPKDTSHATVSNAPPTERQRTRRCEEIAREVGPAENLIVMGYNSRYVTLKISPRKHSLQDLVLLYGFTLQIPVEREIRFTRGGQLLTEASFKNLRAGETLIASC